jgi:WD40 repeat protein
MKREMRGCLVFIGSVFLLFVGSSFAMKRMRPVEVKQEAVEVSPEPLAVHSPVWVKCADGQLLGLPQWKIDQIKVLQVLFVDQKGKNREGDPVDASMCSSDDLKMISNALDVASQAGFLDFFDRLSSGQRQLLINAAGKLEANGIFALCAASSFPQEIQNQLVQGLRDYIVAQIADLPAYKKYILPSQGHNFHFAFGRFVEEGVAGYMYMGYSKDSPVIKYVWDSSQKLIKKQAIDSQQKTILSQKIEGALSFSQDGSKKAFRKHESPRTLIEVGDLIQRKKLCSFVVAQAPLTYLRSLLLSSDGNYVVSFVVSRTDSQGKITIWDVNSCSESKTIDVDYGAVFGLSSDDSKFVVCYDKEIFVYDFPSFELRFSFRASHFLGSFISINNAGNQLITNFDDGMHLWDIDCDFAKKIELFKQEMQRLDVSQVKVLYHLFLARLNNVQPVFHKNSVEYKAYLSLPDFVKEFLAGGLVSDVIAQPKIKEQSEDEDFHERRDMISALAQAMTVPQARSYEQQHNGVVNAIATSQLEFLSGGIDQGAINQECSSNLFLWNFNYQDMQKQYCSDQWLISSIAFSNDGNYFVVGGQGRGENNLTLWDRRTDQKKQLEGSFEDRIQCVAFSPDGSKVVAGARGDKNNLFVWDVRTGKMIHNLEGHFDSVNVVAFGQDGKVIASGSNGNSNNLLLWNVETGNLITSLEGHRDDVRSIAFSPDGWRIVSGGKGSVDNLFLWNSDTFVHNALAGHEASVNVVLFSRDGKKIISAGDGSVNNLCVWNAAGQLLFNLQGHSGSIKSAAFNHSHDKVLLVSGGEGARDNLFVWDVNFGKKLYSLSSNQQVINAVAFSASDTKIVSGGGGDDGENSLIVWDIDGPVAQAVRNLNSAQLRLVYGFYIQSRNNIPVNLTDKSEQLEIYKTLPKEIQQQVCELFNVQGVGCLQQEDKEVSKKRKIE